MRPSWLECDLGGRGPARLRHAEERVAPEASAAAPDVVPDRAAAPRNRALLEAPAARLTGCPPPAGKAARKMSTEEAATDLHGSVNTVKTHLRGVRRKPVVNHRGDAVRRARDLRLL